MSDEHTMEKPNLNWGVVFKVAGKMRDAGVRLRFPPHHPLHSMI